MTIELQNIYKEFGNHVALDNISFTIQEGKLTSLLGPSGCGKTTLLRIISGLEQTTAGKVIVDGVDCTNLGVQKIMGFVFQHYALFRHMSAFENVAFGLRVNKKTNGLSNAEIEAQVHEVLSLVQLDNQSYKYPNQLSGGQQQRVALARVLAVKPKILLLDEPFGALDATVRRDLRRWLRRLHDEIHITTILVTHDQEEALEISDSIALINQGKLEQEGSPRDIYKNPANLFVYEFLGIVNVFSGRIRDHHLVHFSSDDAHIEEFIDTDKQIYVRPHEIEVHAAEEKQEGDLEGVIIRLSFVATEVLIEIRLKKTEKETGAQESTLVEVSITDSEWERYHFRQGDTVFVRTKQFKVFAQA